MSTLSIPAIVMASISFYVGLYHLLIYFRRRQHREDLTFALLCLATGFYDVFCAGLYSATSVAEGVQWQRAQFIALAFFTTAFLWFVSDYTHQKPQLATYAFSAFYLLAVLIQIVDRSSLTWMVDHPSVKEIPASLRPQDHLLRGDIWAVHHTPESHGAGGQYLYRLERRALLPARV